MRGEPRLGPEVYQAWRSSPLGAITERIEQRVIFDLAGALRGRRVLDVGTGDGTYAIGAARRGAEVTGIDTAPAMLAAARTRAEEAGVSVTVREANAENLPFDDDSFDAVLAVTVLCFVRAARTAVDEMARVLVPGGRLVLGELNRFSVWAARRRLRGWLGAETWKSASFWSAGELQSLARDAELCVTDVRGSVFYPPSALAARLMSPIEPLLSRVRTPGAAFLALSADKLRSHS